MKTKISFLILFVGLSISSCIKDFYGHPDDKNGIINETNYFYADDFKTQYLELQIEILDQEIEELKEQGVDPNDSKFVMALEGREKAAEETERIAAYRDIVFKRRPPIPGPCPKVENCFPGVQYIGLPPGLEGFLMIVYDANGGIIGQTQGNPTSLENVDGLLDYVIFINDNPDYSGDIQVLFKEQLEAGDEVLEYKLDFTIGQ